MGVLNFLKVESVGRKNIQVLCTEREGKIGGYILQFCHFPPLWARSTVVKHIYYYYIFFYLDFNFESNRFFFDTLKAI